MKSLPRREVLYYLHFFLFLEGARLDREGVKEGR